MFDAPKPTLDTPEPEDRYEPANDDEPVDYGPLEVGKALGYGWETFKTNLSAWLSVTMLGLVLYAALVAVVWLAEPSSLFSVVLIVVAATVAALLLQACLIRGALYELDGNRPRFGAFLQNLNGLGVLATAVLVLTLVTVGYLLCVGPALVVGLLSMFALHFVIDLDEDPISAVRSSWRLVAANVIPSLLLALANAAFLVAGMLLCGVGLLVALPPVAISTTYAYRRLTFGTVAPLRV